MLAGITVSTLTQPRLGDSDTPDLRSRRSDGLVLGSLCGRSRGRGGHHGNHHASQDARGRDKHGAATGHRHILIFGRTVSRDRRLGNVHCCERPRRALVPSKYPETPVALAF